jgi:small ligand-binding sensory domain FIST
MSLRIGCGLSEHPEARVGALEAGAQARRGLDGDDADLVLVFAAGAHLAAPEASLEGIDEALSPAALVGCGAAGVVGAGREIEAGTAISVWAAAFDEGVAETFHAHVEPLGDALALEGLPSPEDASGLLLLPDPATFPTARVLQELGRVAPAVPVVGGLSSGESGDGGAVLLRDGEVHVGGAVGVRLEGVELLPCVSQGAAPLGPELTITAAEGHVIQELAGRPALEALQHAILGLDPAERALVEGGLLLGIVIDGAKPDYAQGDFLVRGLLGADPEDGTIAVAAPVSAGQVVRLHARDAASADSDLRDGLALRREALGGERPAGALLFTCTGRGAGMFGVGHHDAGALADELGAPAAGFFAAGEIGPVGGEPFVHTFTATVAVFAR